MPARARGWLALVLATCGPQRAVQPRRVAEAAAPRGPRRARGRTASDRCARRSTRGAESRTAEGEAMTHESRTNRTTGTSDPRENRTRSGPVQTAHVRPGVLARALGVDERTVRRWCAEGRIAGAVRTAGGHWRVPRAEYARLTEGRARARAVPAIGVVAMKPTTPRKSRWEPLTETTPSGKSLYRCSKCGRVSVGPDKTCAAGCHESEREQRALAEREATAAT